MNLPITLALIILFGISVPIAVSIGLSSAFGIVFFSNMPLHIVPQKMFVGLDSFPLMAVPFFILAGNLMSVGGVSERLVEFARAMIGGTRGGLAAVCVLASMLFAAVSGSSVATTFAIGAILIPAMIKYGYPVEQAAAIQASSAELGVIIPPSVPLILYGVATETSISKLFLAGFGPGLLIAGALVALVMIWSRVKGYGDEKPEDKGEFGPAFRRAFLALLMPVIIIGGIYGGIFTPTEASAVAVFYGLIVGMFVYKRIKVSDLPEIFRKSVISTTTVMLIISAAALFSFLISLSGLPNAIGEWAQTAFDNKYTLLIAINILLFVVGMFVETASAILVLAPILTPVVIAFGVNPVHFGIIIVANLALGMFTPPLGVNLFAACQVANIPVERIITSLIAPVLTVITCLMLITYIPDISLFLVNLFM